MKYVISGDICTMSNSFTVKDDSLLDFFIVRRRVLSFGKRLKIYDTRGKELCSISQNPLKLFPQYNIYLDGMLHTTVKKSFSLFENYVDISNLDGDYYAEGDFISHEFEIYKDKNIVCRVSKKFFSCNGTYGIQVDPEENQIVIISIVIAIEHIFFHHGKKVVVAN